MEEGRIVNEPLEAAEKAARAFIDAVDKFTPEFKSIAIEYILGHYKYCQNCGQCGCEGWCFDSVLED